MVEPRAAVVLETGTSSTKAGFAAEDAPRIHIPTILGRTRHPGLSGRAIGNPRDIYVGDDAVKNRGLLLEQRPVVRGKVQNWGEYEELVQHALLGTLRAPSDMHPLLYAEAPQTSRGDRETLTTMLFEVLNVPSLAIYNSGSLGLFSTGRVSGIAIDSGAACTSIVPVLEGSVLPHAVDRVEFGGEDVTNSVFDSFRSEGYPFSTSTDRDEARRIKENLMYVAVDVAGERQLCKESTSVQREYCMPDGGIVYLSDKRFEIPEVLVTPPTSHPLSGGLAALAHKSILACQLPQDELLLTGMALCGGNTLFDGLDARFQAEVAKLTPSRTPKCIAFSNRLLANWVGGSILSSLSTFPCMWVSKAEYDEHGVGVIHRKAQ